MKVIGAIKKPEFVVGKDALGWMKQDPENTVLAVKRLMGRSILNREVQKIIEEKRVSYRIDRHSRGTANKLGIMLGEKEFSPEEISAKILEKIRLDAEASFGGEVAYAVITVPAYFNDDVDPRRRGPSMQGVCRRWKTSIQVYALRRLPIRLS